MCRCSQHCSPRHQLCPFGTAQHPQGVPHLQGCSPHSRRQLPSNFPQPAIAGQLGLTDGGRTPREETIGRAAHWSWTLSHGGVVTSVCSSKSHIAQTLARFYYNPAMSGLAHMVNHLTAKIEILWGPIGSCRARTVYHEEVSSNFTCSQKG